MTNHFDQRTRSGTHLENIGQNLSERGLRVREMYRQVAQGAEGLER